MTVPSFNVTTLDGNLGRTLDPTKTLAMVGISSSGTETTPKMMTRVESVIAEYGAGPLVDYAAFAIKAYGLPVLCSKVPTNTDGTASAVTRVGSGTSVITVTSGAKPNNDYEVYFEVVTGGTIGTGGIEYRTSLDGGRTLGPVTALGTANTITFSGAGTLGLSFAAGTLIAGETATCQTTSPTWATADLTDCVDALGAHTSNWNGLSVVGAMLVEDFDAVELCVTTMKNRGRDIWWAGGYRLREVAEDEATYLADFVAEFTSHSTYGGVCADGCRVSSAIDGLKYKRSPLIQYAPLVASVSEEVDVALITLGPLTTCSITDENGNPEDHDESIAPGLDDAGAITLRTWSGEGTGVYFTNPRIFSTATSDFEFVQHRRIVNLALQSVRAYFRKRLSKPIRVNPRTGYILESEAREIERGAMAFLETALLQKPKASAATCAVARDDNVLSTKTLTANIQVVPLGYPKTINLTIGLYNPALVTL